MPTCNNCQQVFEDKYCSHCGQKASAGRLGLHEVYHELVHGFTHADKGIAKLVKDLALAPRRAYHGYFAGQRKTYFSPVVFLLLAMGVLVFIKGQLFTWDSHITDRQNDWERALYGYQKLRYLLALPVMGLLSWAFFHRRFNLAECLVFWFYCWGFIAVVELLVCIPEFVWVRHRHAINYWSDWAIWFIIVIHLFACFYNRTAWAAIRCVLLGVLSYFVLVYASGLIAYFKGMPATFNPWHIIQSVFGR
jgi:hypothetical protein